MDGKLRISVAVVLTLLACAGVAPSTAAALTPKQNYASVRTQLTILDENARWLVQYMEGLADVCEASNSDRAGDAVGALEAFGSVAEYDRRRQSIKRGIAALLPKLGAMQQDLDVYRAWGVGYLEDAIGHYRMFDRLNDQFAVALHDCATKRRLRGHAYRAYSRGSHFGFLAIRSLYRAVWNTADDPPRPYEPPPPATELDIGGARG